MWPVDSQGYIHANECSGWVANVTLQEPPPGWPTLPNDTYAEQYMAMGVKVCDGQVVLHRLHRIQPVCEVPGAGPPGAGGSGRYTHVKKCRPVWFHNFSGTQWTAQWHVYHGVFSHALAGVQGQDICVMATPQP